MIQKLKPQETGFDEADSQTVVHPQQTPKPSEQDSAEEIGGRAGPDPSRFGDWEKNGRCIDF